MLFVLQEELEPILGGVGWEQFGFLQRSQITDTFQLGESSDSLCFSWLKSSDRWLGNHNMRKIFLITKSSANSSESFCKSSVSVLLLSTL